MANRATHPAYRSGLLDEDILLESLPEHVLSTMQVRDRWFARSSATNAVGGRFVVEDLLRWISGHTVHVAFLGGDPTLHRDIEDATRQITDSCNIKLDFGFDQATGTFRTWTRQDNVYAAEIRVSFDQDGYFSLLGTDSINPIIGRVGDPVGGRPNQCSLNVEGFHIQRPASWQGIVRHEFLHALAFHHEHQSPSGGCDDEFRWQDDLGYQPTQDASGRYITDHQGKRPGIYTYLAGFPNFWSKGTVDHNLRSLSPLGISFGPFDRASIMLYRFPPLFYRSSPSPCAPLGNGIALSQGDRDGLALLYPRTDEDVENLRGREIEAFNALISIEDVSDDIKENLSKQLSIITGQ